MNDTIIDLSELNFSIFKVAEPGKNLVLTTQDLLDICGAMDVNALWLASAGLIISFMGLLYVRRFRSKLTKDHQKLGDKAFFTCLMMLFLGIIIRVMRAG